MTQNIVIQIGQCGNQIGYRFWDAALSEHASTNKLSSDEAFSSFFNITDTSVKSKLKGSKQALKARAVLIDMEEGVVNEIMKSPIAGIFDHRQLITDKSGAGNNWAVGHMEYGHQYKDMISDVIRKTAEQCDCLQFSFAYIQWVGGLDQVSEHLYYDYLKRNILMYSDLLLHCIHLLMMTW